MLVSLKAVPCSALACMPAIFFSTDLQFLDDIEVISLILQSVLLPQILKSDSADEIFVKNTGSMELTSVLVFCTNLSALAGFCKDAHLTKVQFVAENSLLNNNP